MSTQSDSAALLLTHPATDREASPTAPLLLTVGSYHGSLAAARCLGRLGIAVELADSDEHTHTAHSKFIRKTVQSPDLSNLDTFGQWLIDFGARSPGRVLYPTSDDMAWIIAKNQDILKKYFHLYQPPKETTFKILNKQHLYQVALSLGLDVPVTHFVTNIGELERIKATIKYPVIVKPKTQVGMLINVKGLICQNATELVSNVRQFLDRFTHKSEILDNDPSLRWPLLQEFHQEASSHTYCLSGFIIDDHSRMVVRAAQKILQQPFKVGVGLAFESRPIHEELRKKIAGLCQTLGYFGAFEAEFIHLPQSGRFLLMDFNPRFFGQMEFDIRRGLPLPYLVYLAALKDFDRLHDALDIAENWNHTITHKFCFGWMMRLLLSTQCLGGRLPLVKRREWLGWAKDHLCYDGIFDHEDKAPQKAYVKKTLAGMVRHPRSNFRYYFG